MPLCMGMVKIKIKTLRVQFYNSESWNARSLRDTYKGKSL